MSQLQSWLGGGQQLGLLVCGMHDLIAALAGLPLLFEDAVHNAG
jgi:hypothetical protein